MATAYRLDALIANGAAANRRAFPGPQKRYCSARRVTKSTGSRHINGYLHAASTRLLLDAAMADGASGFAYAGEVIATVNQAQIKHASVAALCARLSVLNEQEHDAQAEEDRQTLRAATNQMPAQLEAAANADIHEAEILLERASILRELAERSRRGA